MFLKSTVVMAVKAVAVMTLLSMVWAGCGGSSSKALLPAAELYSMGKSEYENKDYRKAIDHLQTVVYSYPGESVIDSAQYYLAMSYLGAKNYTLAGIEFNRLAVNYPSSPFVTSALFMKAVCSFEETPGNYALDQSELDVALRQFEDFIIDHPQSEYVADAQKYLNLAYSRLAHKMYASADVYLRINALDASKIYFQYVVDNYTQTEYAPQATYKIAEIEFKRKNFDEAKKKFDDFLAVYPDHEWGKDARSYAVESAFKGGEKALEKKDYALARERFELFKQSYPQDRRAGLADKYLKEIQTHSGDSTSVDKAGS